MDDHGFAYPGQETLARGARSSIRTIRRHMEQAQKLGWVDFELAGRTGQGWRQYLYRCCVPDHVRLGDKDEVLADAVVSEFGDIERADTRMSSPSPGREDTSVSAPSPKRADTCGQPAQKRGDTGAATCGQAGGQNVRTQLVPRNSRSETPALTHASYEGGALTRPAVTHAIPDETQKAEEIERRRREAARLIETVTGKKRLPR